MLWPEFTELGATKASGAMRIAALLHHWCLADITGKSAKQYASGNSPIRTDGFQLRQQAQLGSASIPPGVARNRDWSLRGFIGRATKGRFSRKPTEIERFILRLQRLKHHIDPRFRFEFVVPYNAGRGLYKVQRALWLVRAFQARFPMRTAPCDPQ